MSSRRRARDTLTAYGLLAPALIIFGAFAFYSFW